jgi:hypothetical protein
MSEEYEDELVTSHSDENPELSNEGRSGPLAAHSTEGSAVSELYKKERDPFHYQPKAGETVIEEEVYIPPEE